MIRRPVRGRRRTPPGRRDQLALPPNSSPAALSRCVLWGECDPFGGVDVAERFVRQLCNAELEMWPAAGHTPWIDDPELASARIAAFFER